ncbi:cytidylate kinase [Alkalihalobacillus alcalophilus ATCC 27647 = CGMCC 1.3604]|uniref:Cytidylate kinase n=1 Tax=Alkalihalobacillus alcalophilus ATCC 27647 = CGMCC 1.3604 TaxID=1218173 RepID=A0A094XK92_ALKAL|nr:(d)CMP kinase [Alkalihalobacillus alcalophilus]KGA99165.1 cytidylate kinase [Alkalihalobacillus alcalophilus ATCC 27647 = CGMCC 1.3604]MED1562488.1 (d)CMP kinase [Alkalihalobacillus alcalophilus]THG90649.1 cytidylate kinase [Alkalihalobacillus alcalophilus ATCC 27647 = CGMCC 1.3604]
MEERLAIAIDGPAGAGKSTVAKLVAEKLSFLYIDTGAMYRALTYAALREDISLSDGKEMRQLLDSLTIRLVNEKAYTKVLLNNEEVTEQIRSNEVNQHVSLAASHQAVREEMVERQRLLAKEGQVVLDGRDIGTHVLPNAKLKIFLTASVDERAKRRHEEQVKKGIDSDLEQLKKDIARRDEFDSTREVAPLKKAEDAKELDTTSLTIDEVVEAIIDLAKERIS